MASTFGNKIKVSIFGESHSEAIGVNIDGLPAGIRIDMDELHEFLDRRAPGRSRYATSRREADRPEFLCGIKDGVTCGTPLTAIIRNTNTRSGDYEEMKDIPRPGHGDLIMSRYGLIGGRLSHSYSPLIHSKFGSYEYLLCETEEENILATLRSDDFDGFNITIPYKETVMDLCDELSEESKKIGCVNTVLKDESGKLKGYNTDYFGFRYLLSHNAIDVKDKKCLVLGSGGASLTVRAVLADLDAGSIIVVSRSGENNYENISRHFDSEIIVNTTPVGMSFLSFRNPIFSSAVHYNTEM